MRGVTSQAEVVEARLVRFPAGADVPVLRAAVRRFEFERGRKVGEIRVAQRDVLRLRWIVILGEMGLQVKEEQEVREGHVVLVAG